jgi:hypothetical protein
MLSFDVTALIRIELEADHRMSLLYIILAWETGNRTVGPAMARDRST